MMEWKEHTDPYSSVPCNHSLALGEGLMSISVYRGTFGWEVNIGSIQVGRLADLEVAKAVGISVARGLLEKALKELSA